MNQELIQQWFQEEECAHIHGWDFSHIDQRYEEENDLPWDYRQVILSHLRPHDRVLDLDTGGGEFLLSLKHPVRLLSATEAYPPNVALCRQTLLPLGVDFRPADVKEALPFDDESFDLVIDRHGDLNAPEIFRVLRPGGLFITQQVGAENDRVLVEMLLPGTPIPYPEQHLHIIREQFQAAGFAILQAEEAFRSIRFFDVGALVWFARIIEWEFPGFSVERCMSKLMEAQQKLERGEKLEGQTHRFLLVAQKMG